VGTGYGEVVDFTTGNAAPVATAVMITGDIDIGAELTVSYTFNDAENDAEGLTTFQWYSATDAAGTGEAAIAGATSSAYTILATDEFKYIKVSVTPKAMTGTTTGIETVSTFVGPVPEAPETVTFMYNGQSVTYGVIISTTTGKKWLDRNLGASQMATAYNDSLAYGDLFQWGRPADGHQLMTWTSATSGTPANTTTTLSSTDVPGHSLFILISTAPQDWLSTQNNNLWGAPNYINNPCPTGWHIPSNIEWEAENINGFWPLGFDKLKLTANGLHRNTTNAVTSVGTGGYYWDSTGTIGTDGNGYSGRYWIKPSDDGAPFHFAQVSRAVGQACRCIKNE